MPYLEVTRIKLGDGVKNKPVNNVSLYGVMKTNDEVWLRSLENVQREMQSRKRPQAPLVGPPTTAVAVVGGGGGP